MTDVLPSKLIDSREQLNQALDTLRDAVGKEVDAGHSVILR